MLYEVITHDLFQPIRDQSQHPVSRRMAQAVVDVLEAVEIEEQDAQPLAAAPGLGDGMVDPIVEEQSVGQIRQPVMVGEVLGLAFGHDAIRHIDMNAGQSDQIIVGVEGGSGPGEYPTIGAILVPQAILLLPAAPGLVQIGLQLLDDRVMVVPMQPRLPTAEVVDQFIVLVTDLLLPAG